MKLLAVLYIALAIAAEFLLQIAIIVFSGLVITFGIAGIIDLVCGSTEVITNWRKRQA